MKTEASERLEDTFDFMEFWRALQRRRRIIWAFTGLLFLLAVIYCAAATRMYSATSTIELKRDSKDSLGLGAELGVIDAGTGDSLAINIEGQTEAGILQSDAFALRVINELHLQDSPDFKGGLNPIGAVLGLIAPKGPADPPNTPPMQRSGRVQGLVAAFRSNLKVTPTPGTRLIDVTYRSKDPNTAKAVVDRLVLDLLNSSSDAQRDATSNSSKFMEDQLAEIRSQTERLQGQVVKMQQQAGIVSLGTTGTSGREQAYSEILDELEQIGTTLGQAQTNRILKGAVYDQIRQGNPELISASSGNLSNASSPGIAISLNTIQNLRLAMTTDQATLAQMEVKFGSAYPKLEETRMQISRYEQQIRDEVSRMRERAKNDYEVAARTEQDARDTYNRLKSKADLVNSSAIGFVIAKEEAESSRKLYEELLSRSKEAAIIQGLKPSNVGIISPAMLPARPSSPRVLLVLAGSLFVGLTVGAGLALLSDLADRRILSVPAVAADLGRSPQAVLPALDRAELAEISGAAGLGFHRLSRSSYMEGVRALGNSLFLSRTSAAPRLLMITSPGDGEGKTMLSASLAALLAQQGKSVLLVDADLRNPGLHRIFKLDNSAGLANLFTSAAGFHGQVQSVPGQPGLSVLTTGSASLLPPDPFSLPRFRELLREFQQDFDCVLIDSTAVLTANDSIPIAGRADILLLVARLNQTKAPALRETIAKLELYVPAESLKLVINGIGSPLRMPLPFHGVSK